MSLKKPPPSEASSAPSSPASPPIWKPVLEVNSKDSSDQPSPPSAPIWKPPSERTIQANRENARRSTGPRTERGKRTVSGNAIKHGILAWEVVITAGDGEESLEDFHDLVKQLDEQYEPVGIVEELLVQEIAACWWKKARVLRAENGETRERLDPIAQDRALRNSEKASLDLALSEMCLEEYSTHTVIGLDRSSALQVARTDLWRSSSGLSYLSRLLERAKSDIASDGQMSREVHIKIYNAFLFWDYPFVSSVCLSGGTTEDQPPEKAVDEKRAAIITSIDNRLEKISTLQAHARERENLAADAEARSFSLPPADATDKLLRYVAYLDNGYAGPLPERGAQRFNHFQANEARDGRGNVGEAGHEGKAEHALPGYRGGGHAGGHGGGRH